MTLAVGMFILGVAAGQFSLVAAGLYLHHRRDRAERAWRGRFQTPVVTQWPREWSHSEELRQ